MPQNVILDGTQISTARAGSDSTMGAPVVELVLDGEGAAAFDAFAKRVYKAPGTDLQTVKFAIVLDGSVLSALTLQSDHFGGEAEISGNFTAEEVDRLTALIDSGALPAPIRELSFSNGDCIPTP